MKAYIRLVYLAIQIYAALSADQTYTATNDNRCIFPNVTAVQNYSLFLNERQCATKCLITAMCAMFMLDSATSSCLLYSPMSYSKYLSVSYYKPKACKLWYAAWADNYALFASSGQFVVPLRVTSLRVLAVGGGGGGDSIDGGGGGSGFVTFSTVSVSPGQSFSVAIGAGGNATQNGGSTTFGGSLVVAAGGNAGNGPPSSYDGGSGGSGGGGGNAAKAHRLSGNGGGAGSSGNNTTNGTNGFGGSGQGASFSLNFGEIIYNAITSGSGADGLNGGSDYSLGGGGGGGVLVNGAGPSSTPSQCCQPTICGPGSATGYGAGGSGACWTLQSSSMANGTGASGLVYLEYD